MSPQTLSLARPKWKTSLACEAKLWDRSTSA